MNATPAAAVPWYRQLHFQILIAMVVGVLLATAFGEHAVRWLGWMGVIFVQLLRMVIVPLIFTSIVSGVASVGGGRSLARLGAKTLAYYVGTSLLAIVVGLALVNAIQPGKAVELSIAETAEMPDVEPPDSLAEIFIRMIPTNPIKAMAEGDMLGVIFFSILLGIAITRLPEPHAPRLRGLFESGFDLMMVLTAGIIRLAPLGVLGLIVRAVASSGLDTFRALGVYMFTVALALAIHLFITLPLLLVFLGRIRPWVHFRNMTDAMVTAFSTSSSSATLPVTLSCVEKKVGVSNKVTSFVLPMGATINMDGTALYECIGVIFISQVMGFGLDFNTQLVIVFTALLASIGAAGVPSAGLVMIFIILDAIKLQGPEVAAIVGAMLAIDRPLDMFRTMVNIFSDSCGAAIIAKSEGEEGIDAQAT